MKILTGMGLARFFGSAGMKFENIRNPAPTDAEYLIARARTTLEKTLADADASPISWKK